MGKNPVALAVLGIAVVLLSTACAPTATPPPTTVGETAVPPTLAPTSPPEPVVLRVGTTMDNDSFHPFMIGVGWRFNDLIWEGFTGYGSDCEIEPRLAESMEVSDDGLTWTIRLRPGITYNDGHPLDAHVLVESWDWLSSLEIGQWLPPIRLAESYEAVDELTFRFTTSAPLGTFESYDAIYQWPFPPHIWGSLDDETIWGFDADANPVGTGPYTLTEWAPGEYMIFDAREDYYLGRPPVDRIILMIYANWDALVNALIGGEIDMTDSQVPSTYFDMLAADPNITVIEQPPVYAYQLTFNVREGASKHPAIDDPRVREAIDYAIDRQQLVDLVIQGHGVTCANSWACGELYEWSFDPSLTETPFDPDRARSILDEAGYLDSDNDGLREGADGENLTLRLFFQADKSDQITVADMISRWLSEVGIGTTVQAVEAGTLQSVMMSERDFDMGLRQRAADPVDPAVLDILLTCWSASISAGSGNASGYCNAELDELIAAQASATSLEDRLPILYEIESIIARDRPLLLLAAPNGLQAYRNDRFAFPDDPCPWWGMSWNWWTILQAEPVR